MITSSGKSIAVCACSFITLYMHYCRASEESVQPFNISYTRIENTVIPSIESQRGFYVEVYAGLVGLMFIVTLTRNLHLVKICMASSAALHDSLFRAVLRAPMRFFEVNSTGNSFRLQLLCLVT